MVNRFRHLWQARRGHRAHTPKVEPRFPDSNWQVVARVAHHLVDEFRKTGELQKAADASALLFAAAELVEHNSPDGQGEHDHDADFF